MIPYLHAPGGHIFSVQDVRTLQKWSVDMKHSENLLLHIQRHCPACFDCSASITCDTSPAPEEPGMLSKATALRWDDRCDPLSSQPLSLPYVALQGKSSGCPSLYMSLCYAYTESLAGLSTSGRRQRPAKDPLYAFPSGACACTASLGQLHLSVVQPSCHNRSLKFEWHHHQHHH